MGAGKDRDAENVDVLLNRRKDSTERLLAIAEAVEGGERTLADLFAGTEPGVTAENIQSRTRGTLLMAISNEFGAMVVTTGNKSEMSVGYSTLYGDMNGGFNPIKDLYKTEVFALSRLRNRWKPPGARGPGGEVIPDRIITKPPTAELREDQKDEDSLPPYEVLDDILERLIDRYEDILKDRFGRLGAADPEAEVKHYRTELANRLADQVANTHLKIYCAGQEALLDHWVPLDAETLETYARRRRFMEADRYDAC